jgi:hypothetical protein
MAQDLGEAILKLSTDTSGMKAGLSEAQNLLEDFLTIEAVKKVIDLGKEMLDSFAVAQRAFVTLQYTTGQSADELHRWAEEMQKVTEFTHEQIETNIPLLAGMGMTENRIKEVMTAAMDLSSVYGVSLDQAVRGLASSLENGTVGMLSRYIPTLRTFTKEQLENGAAIKWTADNYTGAAKTIGESVDGIQKIMANLIDKQKEKIGEQIAATYVNVMKYADVINKIGDVAAQVVGILVKVLVTNQLLVVDFYRFIVDGFKTVANLVQNIWKDILHPDKWIKDFEDAFKTMASHIGDYAVEMKNVWVTVPPAVTKATIDATDTMTRRWVALGLAVKAEADKMDTAVHTAVDDMANRWVAMGGTVKTTHDVMTLEFTGMERDVSHLGGVVGSVYQGMEGQTTDSLVTMADLWKQFLKENANELDWWKGVADKAFEDVFSVMGDELFKGGLNWETFSKMAVHAIGAIVKSLGDRLAASAAADTVEAIAALASIIFAGTAPGLFASAAIKTAGALAAYAAATGLNSFHSGADFTVPPGYPNDSFPMRVESGEHVSVTPAGQDGGEPLHIVVNLDSQPILDAVTRGSRNRRVLISAAGVI